MANIVDPVFEASVLREPALVGDDFDFDALTCPLLQLQGKVDKNPKTAAIILAGGTGERFGKEGGKQLVEIAGKPILTWSAEAFDAVGDVGLIVIVCPEERMREYLARAIDPFPFVTPVVLAPAGSIRQESAFSGLEMVGEEYEYVVLHDGARPLVSPELIEHTINTVKGNFDADGAVVAHPAVDTLKVVEDGVIMGTPDR
ncbi:MAG: NTP transferase domain-containing protein, partial [Enterorhabdus sp.]|nr:NTP transferase domain-containing protein [Enterorhabdus sp.]